MTKEEIKKAENIWSASSKPSPEDEGKELVRLAGRWGVGIEVQIIKPFTYSQGPVEMISFDSQPQEHL